MKYLYIVQLNELMKADIMYTQTENAPKQNEFITHKIRSLRQEINIVDNRPAGILQKNIVPGEGWAQLQMNPDIIVRQNKNVAQLAKLKLGMKDVQGWNNEKIEKFKIYVEKNQWTFNSKTREVDTGENNSVTVKGLLADFNSFLSANAQEQAVASKLTKEGLKEKQEKDVASIMDLFQKQYYPNVEIMTGLDGKRNAGIYEISPSQETPYPLIAKLIYKSERMEEKEDDRVVDKFGQIQLYTEHNPSPDQGWELCVPEGDCMYVGKGADFTIYIVLYKKMSGKTLEKHIQGRTIPKLDAVGQKVAFLHLSAKEKTGQYLVHNDLNTANIMLDENGFMGLVDTDDVGYTGDPACVMNDILTLLNMVKSSMQREEYPSETIKAVINDFVLGYLSVMTSHDKGLAEKIKTVYENKITL